MSEPTLPPEAKAPEKPALLVLSGPIWAWMDSGSDDLSRGIMAILSLPVLPFAFLVSIADVVTYPFRIAAHWVDLFKYKRSLKKK